jgi:hypothetical protein
VEAGALYTVDELDGQGCVYCSVLDDLLPLIGAPIAERSDGLDAEVLWDPVRYAGRRTGKHPPAPLPSLVTRRECAAEHEGHEGGGLPASIGDQSESDSDCVSGRT